MRDEGTVAVSDKSEQPVSYFNIPFEATTNFLQGWYIVYKKLPSCMECGKPIKKGDQVMWKLNQKSKNRSKKKRFVCHNCF